MEAMTKSAMLLHLGMSLRAYRGDISTYKYASRNGDTVEYRSDPIARSDYHTLLETETDQKDAMEVGGKAKDDVRVNESKVRYWSDYSRVFFHHRSVHRLPDLPEWEDLDGDWMAGAETFKKFDEVRVSFLGSSQHGPHRGHPRITTSSKILSARSWKNVIIFRFVIHILFYFILFFALTRCR